MPAIIIGCIAIVAIAGGAYAWDCYCAQARTEAGSTAEVICFGVIGAAAATLIFAAGFLTAELWRTI